MSAFSFLSICVAIGFAVVWSIILLRRIAGRRKVAGSDVAKWIKNVVDSLSGMG